MVTLYLTRLASMSYLSNELERKISIPLAPLCLLLCWSNVSQRHTWILQQLEQTHAVLWYSKYPLSRTYLTLQVEQTHT